MVRQAAVFAAAMALLAAFFLPWMEGTSELAHRSFSGFDFARLVRNFEITAGSPSAAGQIRAAAVILYLAPALAINAAVLEELDRRWTKSGVICGVALVVAGAYCLLILAAVLFLSLIPLNDFARVVGSPRYGFWLCLLASGALAGLGVTRLCSAPACEPRDRADH